MRFVLLSLSILLLVNCSKPKTVLICGDHICINKDEADQYFQENLSIEVKVVDTKFKDKIDLVELNLKENQDGIKKISISSKKKTQKNLKVLSNKEITKIKKNSKKKNKEKKFANKVTQKKHKSTNVKKKSNQKNNNTLKKNVNVKYNDVVDVCSIIKKCDIDEISKYLLNQGKKKDSQILI